jgi:hypothetical protein
LILFLFLCLSPLFLNQNKVFIIDKLTSQKELHKKFLKNSPFKKTLLLTKKERKSLGIPSNKYNEREWELTMNPSLGYPEPYKIKKIQDELNETDLEFRAPGDDINENWTERGPNNVGGRTRALVFDPSDNTNKRVYAGAISGGLWVNSDITIDNPWTQVSGVPGNLNISCITIDPNNSNIWYLGTGESYTFGAAVGNGIYKSTDAGKNWQQVLSVSDFDTDSSNVNYEVVGGIYYVNDIKAWDNNGITELYAAVATHVYGEADDITNYLGTFDAGLYSSIDSGLNWSRDTVVGNQSPNDLEIDASGNLWMATTNTVGLGNTGGKIYRKNTGSGTNFNLVRTLPNALRTEIAASATNSNKFYILIQSSTSGLPELSITNDAFSTAPSILSLPNDPDGSVNANDFTRNQAGYDLVVEVDPTNDAIVYLGGINIHRSTNSGASWNTISHWSTGYSTSGSLVHADQHAIVFRPGNSNNAILGHDGGVSYASSLSTVGNNLLTISDRITNYNVTQFYHMGVAPTSFSAGDYFIAGSQDNGTQLIQNGNQTAPDNSFEIFGGDGAYSFYDQVLTGAGYLIGNYVYNESVRLYDYSSASYRTLDNDNNDNNGDFICQQALDSNLDILYSNYSKGTNYRVRRYKNIVSGTVNRFDLSNNALLTNSPTALVVSPYNTGSSNLIIGTADGKVLKINNADTGSGIWTDISDTNMIGSVSDIEFGQNENEMFVTFHNYAVQNIWYTTNGGISWVLKEGNLPDMPVKCILQNPLDTEEVIVGTELGVWKTNDFSSSSPFWSQSYSGMNDVKVTDLQLRDDNKIFASTFGRGVFSGDFSDNAVLNIDDQIVLSEKFIKIYPTISNGMFFIKSPSSISNVEVKVYDLNGRVAFNGNVDLIENLENKINLDGKLQSGMYLINLSNNLINATTKIIVN